MRTNRKTIAAGAGAAGLLGLGLYLAVPAAANSAPSPSPSSTTAAPKEHPRHGKRMAPLRRVRGVHGEATVRRKDGFHLADWQRGKITAISGTSFTVRSADGATWTWTTNADTRVRKDGGKSTVSALTNGAQVFVLGERSGDTRTAKLVREPKKR
ncbi:DUF5666 domain-containing protein [Actinomadura verrucosospora]|uniref:DUF5666 domain-containing protein n=1 Tax=Actinomadura verrucosospora TaxID=46165 RepID=A0A7D3VUQ4_ACTVE|nr:DUF5666 domain-containing protein [Actinomadura verrucosospora]QKG23433.1 hypothetical protein ACTIVE_5076 [Actinomadura verrucosospora]